MTPGIYPIRVVYVRLICGGFVAALRGKIVCCRCGYGYVRTCLLTELSSECKYLWEISDKISFCFFGKYVIRSDFVFF